MSDVPARTLGRRPRNPFAVDSLRRALAGPGEDRDRWRILGQRALRHSYLVLGALFAANVFLVGAPVVQTFGFDAFAYWSASLPLYDKPVGEFGAFLYSPAFFQLTEPLRALEWTAFIVLWTAIGLSTAVWLGPLALALPFTSLELYHGNVHLLIAAAIVLGVRHPAAWAFVLHTKPTLGIGLLWFVVRHEWRQLAIALGATVLVAAISFALDPGSWVAYAGFLVQAAGHPDPLGWGLPLVVRLPIAAVLVTWGARTDRRWTVPLAATVALPNLWYHGLAVAAGALALVDCHRWQWHEIQSPKRGPIA